MLIVLSGLPAVGKTAIARALAAATGAVQVRIDSIEQALRSEGCDVEGQGYRVGYAVAEDNLRLGRTVVADSVNPWPLTRAEWRAVADRAGVRALDVEVICSDADVHRRRVEVREADYSRAEAAVVGRRRGARLPSVEYRSARHRYRAAHGRRSSERDSVGDPQRVVARPRPQDESFGLMARPQWLSSPGRPTCATSRRAAGLHGGSGSR